MSMRVGPKNLYTLPQRSIDPFSGVYPGLALCFMLVMTSIWVSTQYVASALGYQAKLGAPLFHQLYTPVDLVVWEARYDRPAYGARVQAIFARGRLVAFVGFALSLVSAGTLVAVRSTRSRRQNDLYGSAHWATEEEILGTGLLDQDDGVYVGAWEDPRTGRIKYLRHNGPEHVMVFAPTRSGKGVGLVIPTLLSWPHSVLVNDIKGENWELTAGWRHRDLGSVCLKFDPTNNDGTSTRFNPLEEIRIGTDDEVRDVQNIATMIVDPDGKGLNDHWTKTGFSLLVGTILHVLYVEPDKTLRGVAAYLADPRFDAVDQMFENMLKADHDSSGSKGWIDAAGEQTRTHPVVAQSAKDMLNKAPNEKSGVLSTAMSFLTLYRDPIVARNTEMSDFKLADLMNSQRPMSLYLVIPPSDKDRLKPLIRLVINQTVRTLAQRLRFQDGRSVATYRHRLLMLVDEFPALGRLDVLQEALAFVAGYGIKAYLISQDLSQLYAAYGNEEAILANCNVRVAFAPNKVETAEVLSKMAGSATVCNPTRSYSGGRLSVPMHVVTADQQVMRPLLTPDEAMRLPPRDALIFVAGHAPIYGRKIRYFEDPTFLARARIAPPTHSSIDPQT
jgi:type IV secretion system protein VirD4